MVLSSARTRRSPTSVGVGDALALGPGRDPGAQRRPEGLSAIVIAGNDPHRHRQPTQLDGDGLVLRRLPVEGEVARDEHGVGRGVEREDGIDRRPRHAQRIDDAVGELTRRLDVQIADLGYQQRSAHGIRSVEPVVALPSSARCAASASASGKRWWISILTLPLATTSKRSLAHSRSCGRVAA